MLGFCKACPVGCEFSGVESACLYRRSLSRVTSGASKGLLYMGACSARASGQTFPSCTLAPLLAPMVIGEEERER